MDVSKRRRAKRGDGERLATDILDAATALLVETGSADAVSIRAVAQRAGVTSPSIYLHFADKDALLTAVVARYYEQLDVAIHAAEQQAANPLDAARAQGLAYVKFALDTPELYRLAAMTPTSSASDVDVVLNNSAFRHLHDNVRTLQAEGYYAPGDPRPIALQMLTIVHGVASLLIAKPFLIEEDPMVFADRVICGACLGIAMISGMSELPDGAGALRIARDFRAGPESR